MTQNINLIENLNLQPTSLFNSKLIVQISLGWILLLILVYFLAFGVNANKQKTLLTLEDTHKNLLEKISSYNQVSVMVQNQLLTDIRSLPIGSLNLLGFSSYLEDLAKYTPDGVWLSEIVFSEADNVITLKGSAISAIGVSTFLRLLEDKSVRLHEKKLDMLQLEKNSETNNIDFIVGSVITNPNETKK
jgi:Tfp pilus assembly protein PilN